MYLADYHNHTLCSPDSTAPLEEMARAALQAGLSELCTTDHCDLQLEDGSLRQSWDWAPILEQYARVRPMFEGELRLSLGLELGGAPADPEQARRILAGAPLDFVIGSVHNLSPAAGGDDLYTLFLQRPEARAAALDDYFPYLLQVTQSPFYDALGHILYPLRYMPDKPALDRWDDLIDEILRAVARSGRAIEVNANRGRQLEDWRSILARYRALGGEYVTLGSDAHQPAHVGLGLPRAAELLRDTGFRYVTLYRGRRPEPVRL